MRRTGVSTSSEDPSSSSLLRIELLFGAFLQDHGSGGKGALGSFRFRLHHRASAPVKFLLGLRERKCFAQSNVFSTGMPQRMDIAAATSCCERIGMLLGFNLISHYRLVIATFLIVSFCSGLLCTSHPDVGILWRLFITVSISLPVSRHGNRHYLCSIFVVHQVGVGIWCLSQWFSLIPTGLGDTGTCWTWVPAGTHQGSWGGGQESRRRTSQVGMVGTACMMLPFLHANL